MNLHQQKLVKIDWYVLKHFVFVFFWKGQHRIDITFANVPVQGSPFFTEVYDPSQVRIGPLPRDIIAGTENTFEINLDNAGNVPLEIKISSPTGANGTYVLINSNNLFGVLYEVQFFLKSL